MTPNMWTWCPPNEPEGGRELLFKAPPFVAIFDILEELAGRMAPVVGDVRRSLPHYGDVLRTSLWPRRKGDGLDTLAELQEEGYTLIEIVQVATDAITQLHEQIAFIPVAEAKAVAQVPFIGPGLEPSTTS